MQVGCICNNAVLKDGKVLGPPTEGAILRACYLVSHYIIIKCRHCNEVSQGRLTVWEGVC